jgi:hypothetical protein
MATQFFAVDYAYGINPEVEAGIVVLGTSASGAGTVTVNKPTITLGGNPVNGRSVSVYNTNAPISIGNGSNAETVTPSAVSNVFPGGTTQITATFSNIHGSGCLITSGTVGLQEAINDCVNRSGGGAVVIDGRWVQYGGTTAMLTAAVGGTNVIILDYRGSQSGTWVWNGTAFVFAGFAGSANAFGGSFVPFVNSELLTLSTIGLTTDTVGNLLPANSIILAVQGTVNTTITTSTNWQLGDATTAGRFSAVDTTLTAGESVPKASFPPVQIGTGVASATTGMYQAAAAKVRVTVTGANPGAGKVRITVYGFTLVNTTS